MTGDTPREPEPARRRLRWLRREGIDLGDAVVQFVAVLLGVLLALLIDQWNTARQQRAAVRQATQAIHAELVTNRARLHASAAALHAVAEQLQQAPANQGQPPRRCAMWNGWQEAGTVLTDAAYQTAIATQALANMPFKQAQRIAQAYGFQAANQKAFDVIRDKFFIAGPYSVDDCVHFLAVFVSNEQLASSAYAPLIGPDATQWPSFAHN